MRKCPHIEIVVAFLMLIALEAKTQSYVPFPDSAATWVDEYKHYIDRQFYNHYFTLCGDTFFNGYVYHKICNYNNQLIGGIRESKSKSIYYTEFASICCNQFYAYYQKFEIKLYDFNVNVGDTVKLEFVSDGISDTLHRIVTSIEIDSTHSNRKKYGITIPYDWGDFTYDYWYEGVGSQQGLFGSYFFPFEDSQDLCYFYQGITKETYYFYCAPLATESNTQDETILIFPNPSYGDFQINLNGLKQEQLCLKIVDLLGQIVYNETINQINDIKTIHFNNNSSGIYFLSLMNSDKVLITQRLVKQ